jgi:hypothetical protein
MAIRIGDQQSTGYAGLLGFHDVLSGESDDAASANARYDLESSTELARESFH